MITYIKIWWYYSILHKVVLDENGKPYDRKGLQIEEGKYKLTTKWEHYSYLGNGMYCSPRGMLQVDMKNPFYLDKVRIALAKFKGKEVANEN